MKVMGQTANDDDEVLFDGPGSVDLGLDGEVWLSVGIPPAKTLKLRWYRDERYWECYSPIGDIPGSGHWVSLIVLDD